MTTLTLSKENLRVITKPIESIDIFDDYENYFKYFFVNHKSTFNYNDDFTVRMLYICVLTNKHYDFKIQPIYKYFDVSSRFFKFVSLPLNYFDAANNYKNTLQCHVEFIILKYKIIEALQNEINNLKEKKRVNHRFMIYYRKIANLFKNLDEHDAYQISEVILHGICTLTDSIDIYSIYGNTGDYCECLIELLLLIKESLFPMRGPVELSYNFTHFLISNPDFKTLKIHQMCDRMKKTYVLNEMFMRSHKRDKFYYYNIIQLKRPSRKNNLFLENENIFMLELVAKLILKNASIISSYLFRTSPTIVFRYILSSHANCQGCPKQNILSRELFVFIRNQIIKNQGSIECGSNNYFWKYNFHYRSLSRENNSFLINNPTCFICELLHREQTPVNSRKKLYRRYSKLDRNSNRNRYGEIEQDEDFCYCDYEEFCLYCHPGEKKNKYIGINYNTYGEKVINFIPKSRDHKKSRYIDKSRVRIREKNKIKVKNTFRSFKY